MEKKKVRKKHKEYVQKNSKIKSNEGNLLLGRIVFTSIYLFVIYWFQSVDVWNKHFAEPGSVYIFYNLFRIIFLLYFAWILFSLGKSFLIFIKTKQGEFQLDSLHMFLASSYIGASFLIVVIFILGFLKLYYVATALIITAPIIFLSYKDFKNVVESIPRFFEKIFREYLGNKGKLYRVVSALLIGAILYQFLCVFISKGLMPDLVTNDTIGHYLPYYQEVIKNHNIWMNKYIFHYYYSKGAGLFFLASLLSDIQSTQLVSFYFFLLSAVALYAFIKKISNNELLWMLLALTLYFSSSIILNESGLIVAEFQKLHIMVGAFIIFIIYLTILSFSLPLSSLRLWILAHLLIVSSAIIISPVSFAFILPYLLLQTIMFLAIKNSSLCKYSLLSIILTSAFFISVLGFNLISSGLAEATPLPLFFKYRNESIMSKWVSPSAVLFQIQLGIISGEGAGEISNTSLLKIDKLLFNFKHIIYDDAMIPFPIYLVLLSFTIILISILLKKRLLNGDILKNILPISFMLFICFLLFLITEQHSIYRYTVFLIFFKIFLFIYVLIFLTMLFPAENIRKNISIFVVIIASIFSLVNFYSFSKNQILSAKEKFYFLKGVTSYADLYQKRWGVINFGLEIQKAIGYDKKVIVMNFLPGLYGLPKSGFQRPLMCDYNKNGDFENIMFGASEKAIESLKNYNINHFLIIFNQPLLFTAYAPLFEPQNIKSFFKIAGMGENVLLLTWRSENETEIKNDIIIAYQKIQEMNRMHPYGKTYESVKNMHRKSQ